MQYDLDYMIAVMQAAKEGKKILYCSKKGLVSHWELTEYPSWDWFNFDYCIKPESKSESKKSEYVPYESTEEFIQAQQEHGIYFTFKTNKLGDQEYYLPTSVSSNKSSTGVWNDGIRITFESLLENYMWRDGTPCGKLK